MNNDFIFMYDKFLNEFGIESQHHMCIEEMSELTKAICKFERFKGTDKESEILDNLKEEIADVLNMVEELEHYYGIEDIENIRKSKIDRAKSLYFKK